MVPVVEEGEEGEEEAQGTAWHRVMQQSVMAVCLHILRIQGSVLRHGNQLLLLRPRPPGGAPAPRSRHCTPMQQHIQYHQRFTGAGVAVLAHPLYHHDGNITSIIIISSTISSTIINITKAQPSANAMGSSSVTMMAAALPTAP